MANIPSRPVPYRATLAAHLGREGKEGGPAARHPPSLYSSPSFFCREHMLRKHCGTTHTQGHTGHTRRHGTRRREDGQYGDGATSSSVHPN
jgi:hypothetical protein